MLTICCIIYKNSTKVHIKWEPFQFDVDISYFNQAMKSKFEGKLKMPEEQPRSKSRADKKLDVEFALSSLIYKQKSCEVCSKKHNEAKMILCDRCEDAYHIKCLKMEVIPQGTWICRQCHLDSIQLKQRLKMNKRPYEKSAHEECARCEKKSIDTF